MPRRIGYINIKKSKNKMKNPQNKLIKTAVGLATVSLATGVISLTTNKLK